MVNLVPSPKTATSVSSGRFGRASGVASGAGAGAVWANRAPRLANASKQTTFIGIVLAYHGARDRSVGWVAVWRVAVVMGLRPAKFHEKRKLSRERRDWWGGPPWSAADAPVGLLAPCKMLMSLFRQRDAGVPRGPGGPPHQATGGFFRQSPGFAASPYGAADIAAFDLHPPPAGLQVPRRLLPCRIADLHAIVHRHRPGRLTHPRGGPLML